MTIMDKGLRERRAQIRAQKRAERLKAREGRSRPVKKGYDDPTGEEMYGYEVPQSNDVLRRRAREHVFKPRETLGYKKENEEKIADWHRERGVEPPKTASNTIQNPTTGSTTTSRADRSDIARTTDEDNYKEALGHPTEADTTNSGRQRLLTKVGRESTYEDNSGKVPEEDSDEPKETQEGGNTDYVYNPDLSMKENIRRQAGIKNDDERIEDFKQNMMKYGYGYAEKVLDEDKEALDALDERFNPNKIDKKAQEEYREETRKKVSSDKIDAMMEQGLINQKEREAQEAKLREEEKARAEEEAYAGEMDQQRYDLMREHAGKFLKAMAGAAVDNIDRISTTGWDVAGNLVKAMFTQPHALSSASRVIGSAMAMNDAIGRMAEDTSNKYGIAVNADPELIKDTLKYKAYQRAKKADGQVMGNAMRTLDKALKSTGAADISQLDATGLNTYTDAVTNEMTRIRMLLDADTEARREQARAPYGARPEMFVDDIRMELFPGRYNYNDPQWKGKLREADRSQLVRTYNILTDHMRELAKHGSELSKQEKQEIARVRAQTKADRQRQYNNSPVGWAVSAVSPSYGMSLGPDGLPSDPRNWRIVENEIAHMLATDRATGSWRHPEEEYTDALKLFKDARDKMFKTKNKDSVKAYESSPYSWALKVAFPSYTIPVDYATGLPADVRHLATLTNTIESMKNNDLAKGDRSRQKMYDDALSVISRYKEDIKERNLKRLAAPFGEGAEYIMRYMPNIAGDLVLANETGIWGSSGPKVAQILGKAISDRHDELMGSGWDPRKDDLYKDMYCKQKSIVFSKNITQLYGKISTILNTRLLMMGITPEGREKDLRDLSSMLDGLRAYYPVSANQAYKVNLDKSDLVGAEVNDKIEHLRKKYRVRGSTPTTSSEETSDSDPNPGPEPKPEPKPEPEPRTPFGPWPYGSPDDDVDEEESSEYGYVVPINPKNKKYFQRQKGISAYINATFSDVAEKMREYYNDLVSGDESAPSKFSKEYESLYKDLRRNLDYFHPTWWTDLDDFGKEHVLAKKIDEYLDWDKKDRGNEFGGKFPSVYGVTPEGYWINPRDPRGKRTMNGAFVSALYKKDKMGGWTLRDPLEAAANIMRVASRFKEDRNRPMTYEDALDWVNNYHMNVLALTDLDEMKWGKDEGKNPPFIISQNNGKQSDDQFGDSQENTNEDNISEDNTNEDNTNEDNTNEDNISEESTSEEYTSEEKIGERDSANPEQVDADKVDDEEESVPIEENDGNVEYTEVNGRKINSKYYNEKNYNEKGERKVNIRTKNKDKEGIKKDIYQFIADYEAESGLDISSVLKKDPNTDEIIFSDEETPRAILKEGLTVDGLRKDYKLYKNAGRFFRKLTNDEKEEAEKQADKESRDIYNDQVGNEDYVYDGDFIKALDAKLRDLGSYGKNTIFSGVSPLDLLFKSGLSESNDQKYINTDTILRNIGLESKIGDEEVENLVDSARNFYKNYVQDRLGALDSIRIPDDRYTVRFKNSDGDSVIYDRKVDVPYVPIKEGESVPSLPKSPADIKKWADSAVEAYFNATNSGGQSENKKDLKEEMNDRYLPELMRYVSGEISSADYARLFSRESLYHIFNDLADKHRTGFDTRGLNWDYHMNNEIRNYEIESQNAEIKRREGEEKQKREEDYRNSAVDVLFNDLKTKNNQYQSIFNLVENLFDSKLTLDEDNKGRYFLSNGNKRDKHVASITIDPDGSVKLENVNMARLGHILKEKLARSIMTSILTDKEAPRGPLSKDEQNHVRDRLNEIFKGGLNGYMNKLEGIADTSMGNNPNLIGLSKKENDALVNALRSLDKDENSLFKQISKSRLKKTSGSVVKTNRGVKTDRPVEQPKSESNVARKERNSRDTLKAGLSRHAPLIKVSLQYAGRYGKIDETRKHGLMYDIKQALSDPPIKSVIGNVEEAAGKLEKKFFQKDEDNRYEVDMGLANSLDEEKLMNIILGQTQTEDVKQNPRREQTQPEGKKEVLTFGGNDDGLYEEDVTFG